MAVLKDFYEDKLRVRVFDTRQAMGECAGNEAAACIKALLEQKDVVNVMFAAAPSQNETLQTLCADPDIDWSRVNAFHMDEYVGLDPSHPAGFRNFLRRAIFDHKPFKSVHLLNGNAEDPWAEADRYHTLLAEHPLDVCILGIGENGHIAFNDPPVADFNGCFASIDQVPTHALSATIPGLCAAKYMFCSVPASTKALAVKHTVEDAVSTACPATILKEQLHACLYTDKDAGQYLLDK